MEVPGQLLAALPALATVLALLLSWLLVRRGAAAGPEPASKPAPLAEASGTREPPDPCSRETAGPGQPEGAEEPAGPAEELGAEVRQEEEQDSDSGQDPPPTRPQEEDGEAFSFKYSPGQLRGNQYKKMMTKEELEEEQRVQKEQLAAIFQLMKETFGEMADGDVQDQLRLYDM